MKDSSMREGTAYFDIDKNGSVFFVDFAVSEMAARQFWQGRDTEEIAVEQGELQVRQLIDTGRFTGRPDSRNRHLKFAVRFET